MGRVAIALARITIANELIFYSTITIAQCERALRHALNNVTSERFTGV